MNQPMTSYNYLYGAPSGIPVSIFGASRSTKWDSDHPSPSKLVTGRRCPASPKKVSVHWPQKLSLRCEQQVSQALSAVVCYTAVCTMLYHAIPCYTPHFSMLSSLRGCWCSQELMIHMKTSGQGPIRHVKMCLRHHLAST